MNATRGPHRLILIRSGVYDYAEVEIDRPLHLVAANNVGKTTLIAALQFLYVDDQRQMHFSHDWSATKKHYFPHPNSFVLFECMTDLGWRVIGARGLGASQAHQFERFVHQGQFERDDYLDGRRFRHWREVRDRLVAREYRTLRSRDLRQALMGTLEDAPLGLVPLRQSSNYQSFRVLFRNLLRLSHLSARDLKDLLIDIHAHLLGHRSINLEDSHEQYQRAMRKAEALRELQQAEGVIREVIDIAENRHRGRGELAFLWEEIRGRFDVESTQLSERLAKRDVRIEELARAVEVARQELVEFRQQLDGVLRESGAVESRLSELDLARQRFADFDPHRTSEEVDQCEGRREKIVGRLHLLSDADPARVARRVASLKERIEKNRRIVADLKDLVITRLRADFDLSDDEIGDAFRVLNPEWLRLPLDRSGDGGLEIIDPDAVVERLRRIAACVDGDQYEDDLMRVGATALPERPDLSEEFDPEELEARIDEDKRELVRMERLQKDLQKRQELEDEKSRLEERLEELRKQLHQWREWQKSEEKRPELESRRTELRDEKKRLDRVIAGVEESRRELEEKGRREQHERDAEIRQKHKLEHDFAELPRLAFEAEPVSPVDDRLFEAPLLELFGDYRERYRKERAQSRRMEQILSQIEKDTTSRFVGVDDETTLLNLAQALESLEEQQRAIDELWRSLIAGLRRQLKGLLDDLRELKNQVGRLNRALAGRQISNLERLELVVRPDEVLVGRIEDILAYEEQPLFADARRADEASRALARLLEDHPRLELRQLFGLQFLIEKDSGQIKRFDPREQIESTGTTVTSKVLIHLELLHRMLRENEAMIPFFLDEVSMLDARNLSEIVEHARQLNFVPVVASPEPSDCVDTLYFLRSSEGNVRLEPATSRVRLVHEARDTLSDEWPVQAISGQVNGDE